MKRIVAISPHSDDIELGCAGYLAKMIEQGHDVTVILGVTQDVTTLEGEPVDASTRHTEFRQSMKALGVTNFSTIYQFEDEDFDLCSVPKSKTVGALDKLISCADATEVLIPVPSFHQEHQYMYECCIAATRPTKSKPLTRVLAYTYPGGVWGPSSAFDTSKGSLYIDITNQMDKKVIALSCHQSQGIENERRLISVEGMMRQCALWGIESGSQYAEMLYFLRGVES